MSRRKKQNHQNRIDRSLHNLLSINKVCIVRIDEPVNFQTTFHHISGKRIAATDRIIYALNKVPHKWTFFQAVFCNSGRQEYTKAHEIEFKHPRLVDALKDQVLDYKKQLRGESNPNHIRATGMISFPYPIEFSQEEADLLFTAAFELSQTYTNT